MTPFYVYNLNDNIQYSAKQIIENSDKIFLIESNKFVNDNDIISLDENLYDINDNDFYVMIVIDKNTKDIIVSYGMFSYCHSLYYYKNDKNFYINISLHDLINDIKIPLTLNLISVNEFVKYGFVEGDKTLIKEIKKVPSLKTVIFNNDSIETIDSKYIERKSKGNYIDNLNISFPSKNNKILIPLSGGFDSTLLAYLMKDYNDKLAVTVGSLYDPTSEFKNANMTASYLNIPQQKIYSNNKWIDSLPKIVDIMEGEMFDIGVFLCYFLVNKIKLLNLVNYTFITGNGADQILNKNFFTEDFNMHPKLSRYDNKFLHSYPKHFFYYLIVKKLEWLLRLDDINYVMPFISKEFYDCSKHTTFTEQKREYKEFVKSYIPKEISEPLRKRGGLVNEKYFVDDKIYKVFLEILNLPKYQIIFDDKNNNLRNVIYKMYIVFFNYIFIKKGNIDLTFDELLNVIKN